MTSMGSEIASFYIQPKIGCDIQVLSAIAKKVIENQEEDEVFIQNFTSGFEAYRACLEQMNFNQLCKESVVAEQELNKVATSYGPCGARCRDKCSRFARRHSR